MPSYLDHRLNWQTFSDKVTELFPGITMHLCPGFVESHAIDAIEMQCLQFPF